MALSVKKLVIGLIVVAVAATVTMAYTWQRIQQAKAFNEAVTSAKTPQTDQQSFEAKYAVAYWLAKNERYKEATLLFAKLIDGTTPVQRAAILHNIGNMFFLKAIQVTGVILRIAYIIRSYTTLIFLVSDFHMPLEHLEETLLLMLRHHIVPVVLWNSSEYKDLPEFGITSINDPETGERRTLFLRASYRQRILDTFAARRKAIEDIFMKFDMQPFFVEDTFDADLLSDYFHQYVTV